MTIWLFNDYLYLQFPEFVIIIGTIFAVYFFKNTVLFLLAGTVERKIYRMDLFAHQLYFLNIPIILLESSRLYPVLIIMLLLNVYTVNSFNSINIIGLCTSQCMLPIQPFYRLTISFILKRNTRILFVESVH